MIQYNKTLTLCFTSARSISSNIFEASAFPVWLPGMWWNTIRAAFKTSDVFLLSFAIQCAVTARKGQSLESDQTSDVNKICPWAVCKIWKYCMRLVAGHLRQGQVWWLQNIHPKHRWSVAGTLYDVGCQNLLGLDTRGRVGDKTLDTRWCWLPRDGH